MKDLDNIGSTPIHGWLVIDKSLGMTSNAVVGRVKRVLQKIKVGHAGTLDPLAEGVLPLALGEATKAISFLTDAEKEYVFEVTWGEQRTTDDQEGTIIASSTKRPTVEEITTLLPSFMGCLKQIPPQYCAKKVQGRRACDLLRKGHELVDLEPALIKVSQCNLLDYEKHKARFHIVCSKGTYVRSLARDLGKILGCYGYASRIIRTRVGPFRKEWAISIEKLEEFVKIGIVPNVIQPLQAVLDDIPAVLIDANQAQKLRWGQAVVCSDATLGHDLSLSDRYICLTADRVPVAVAQWNEGQLYPKRVFNLINERKTDVDYT